MPQDAPPQRRRGLRLILWCFGALAVVLVVVLASGRPQHAFAEYYLSRELNGIVTIEGLRTWGAVRADRIVIAGLGSDGNPMHPVVVAEGLHAEYRLPGISDRQFGSVSLEALQIHLDARTGQPSNFAFLTERPRDPEAAGIDPRYLPERVEIARLDVITAVNRAATQVRGLHFEGGFPGNDSASIELRGDRVDAVFAGLVEGLEPTAISGDIDLRMRVDGATAMLTAHALLDGAGDLSANARAALSASWLEPNVELRAIDAALGSASLDGRVLDEFVEGLTGGTVAFDALIADPSRVQFDFAEGLSLPAIEGGVLVQGLRLRAAGQTVYEGDITLTADVPGGDVAEGTMRLSLDEAHIITARISGSRNQGRATVEGDAWHKDRLVALLPATTHAFVRNLDFQRADLRAHVEWSPESVTSEGRLLSSAAAAPLVVYAAQMPAEDLWSATAHVALGAGTIDLAYTGRALDPIDADITFANLDLNRVLPANDSGDTWRGTTSGSVTVEAAPGAEYIAFVGSATISGFAFDPVAFETLTAEIGGRMGRDAARAEIAHITFDAGDGLTRANFADVVVNFDPLYVRTQMAATLDLMHAGRWYDMPELYGDVEITGPVGYANGTVGLPLTVRCTTLGYGDLLLPYRTVIQTELTADYDTGRQTGHLQGVSMKVGEGTQFSLMPSDFTFDPLEFSTTRFDLLTDLTVAAGMGLFAAVDGNATVGGSIGYQNGGVEMEWVLDSSIERAVFPEGIAAAENLAIYGRGRYAGVLSGSGSVSADRLTVAGGQITGLSGAMRIADSVVSIPDLRGDVFNGRFVGQTAVHILEPGFPTEITGRLTAFDLARFTDEVRPPETRLTGIADATFSLRNTINGLDDLTVHATSTENFSLNRDMVRKILESEALAGALGIAQIERTVSRFLGDAPQRPFDSAELTLRDEGDRMRGTAVLLSEKTPDYNGLNLTIDLAIDDEALLQTLKMLEESEISNVHF